MVSICFPINFLNFQFSILSHKKIGLGSPSSAIFKLHSPCSFEEVSVYFQHCRSGPSYHCSWVEEQELIDLSSSCHLNICSKFFHSKTHENTQLLSSAKGALGLFSADGLPSWCLKYDGKAMPYHLAPDCLPLCFSGAHWIYFKQKRENDHRNRLGQGKGKKSCSRSINRKMKLGQLGLCSAAGNG